MAGPARLLPQVFSEMTAVGWIVLPDEYRNKTQSHATSIDALIGLVIFDVKNGASLADSPPLLAMVCNYLFFKTDWQPVFS